MFYPFLLAAIVSLYGIYNMPGVKGWCGEALVRYVLSTLPKEYIVMNDLYIPAYDGMYTQIDHLVISGGGIIVIETKNYSGKISGNSRKKYWVSLRGGKLMKVYNPIRQNSYHIKMLKENCPGLESIKVKSLICLISSGNIGVETKVPIAGPFGVRKKIMQIVSIEKTKINPVEIRKLIDSVTLPAKQASSKHKKMLATRTVRLKKGLCPRCSAKLLRKKGMRGEYYICSNYPACKFRISNRL